MAQGFGGDARMALLMGITKGVNNAREEKRAVEREGILNRQAEQQITESQERITRNAAATERAAKAEEVATVRRSREEATNAQEAKVTATRMQSIAEMVVAGNPEITMEQAIALAPNLPAATINRLLGGSDTGEDLPDPLNPLEIARQREVDANAAEQELENERETEMRNLRNSPEGLRLRRNLLSGDRQGLEIAITSATAGETPLHSQEAVMSYLAEIQPKDETGTVKLSDGQKSAARVTGSTAARGLIQQVGSLEAAIAIMTRQVNEAPSDDPFTAATQNEIMEELRRMHTAALSNDTVGGVTLDEVGN